VIFLFPTKMEGGKRKKKKTSFPLHQPKEKIKNQGKKGEIHLIRLVRNSGGGGGGKGCASERSASPKRGGIDPLRKKGRKRKRQVATFLYQKRKGKKKRA